MICRRSEGQPEQLSRSIGNPEVDRNLSRAILLGDASIKAKQDDRHFAVERLSIVYRAAATGNSNSIEVCFQNAATLIIEQRTLNNPIVEGSQVREQPQRQRAVAVSKTSLILPEASQLGTACNRTRLARDGSTINFAASDGKCHVRHFAHSKCAGVAHFDVIASAGSIRVDGGSSAIADAAIAVKRKPRAPKRGRDGNSFSSWLGSNVINGAFSQLPVKIGSAFFSKNNGIANPKIGIGGNLEKGDGSGGNGFWKVSEIQQARGSARGPHGDHAILARKDRGLAALCNGHRSIRFLAGNRASVRSLRHLGGICCNWLAAGHEGHREAREVMSPVLQLRLRGPGHGADSGDDLLIIRRDLAVQG